MSDRTVVWPARQAALSRPDLDWASLEYQVSGLAMYEKLLLFGRHDCPTWMLLHIYRLPPQLCLAGKDDINEPLRNAAKRRLRAINALPSDESGAVASK